MKRGILVALLLACREPGQPKLEAAREWISDTVYVIHDDHRMVTCWIATAVPDANYIAIACMSDRMMR